MRRSSFPVPVLIMVLVFAGMGVFSVGVHVQGWYWCVVGANFGVSWFLLGLSTVTTCVASQVLRIWAWLYVGLQLA